MPTVINKPIIQDVYPLEVLDTKTVIKEGKNGKKPALKVTGIFQKADTKNANGRIYPQPILKEAVLSIQDEINKRAVMGEFDHPCDAKIHLDRVSHVITKLWMEGKTVYGEAEILADMPCGAMLATLLKNNVQVGISSRGVGDMEMAMEGREEIYRVNDGYSIITFDMVAEPSVQSAVMTVCESKSNRILTRSVRAQLDPAAELVREFKKWLR